MNIFFGRLAAASFMAMAVLFHAGPGAASSVIVVKKGEFSDDLFATGDKVTVEGNLAQDLYAAGGKVGVRSKIGGDLFAVGGKVSLGDETTGTVLSSGGKIELTGDVGEDAFMMGGVIDVDATISGNILASGGDIRLGDRSLVEGKATFASGELYVGGRVEKGLKAAGKDIVIAGVINGNVKLMAETITILPSARIAGDLVYRSPHAINISDDAQVGGDITFVKSEDMRRGVVGMFAIAGATHLSIILGLVLVAAVFAFVFPTLFPTLRTHVIARPWKVLGIGLAILIGGPFLIVLLFASAIGAPLAFILATLYMLMVCIGFFAVAYGIGLKIIIMMKRDGSSTVWRRLGVTTLGLVILGLVAVIPILGALILILCLSLGIGALVFELKAIRAMRGAA